LYSKGHIAGIILEGGFYFYTLYTSEVTLFYSIK